MLFLRLMILSNSVHRFISAHAQLTYLKALEQLIRLSRRSSITRASFSQHLRYQRMLHSVCFLTRPAFTLNPEVKNTTLATLLLMVLLTLRSQTCKFTTVTFCTSVNSSMVPLKLAMQLPPPTMKYVLMPNGTNPLLKSLLASPMAYSQQPHRYSHSQLWPS